MAQTVQDTLSVTESTGSSNANVSATPTESVVLLDSGGNSLRLGVDTASGAGVGTVNAFPFAIRTGGEPRIFIEGDGDIGIGTSAPGAKLAVNGLFKLETGAAVNKFSTDVNLTENSDSVVPTSRAVKTYVDTRITPVATALNTKAALAGAVTQDFSVRNLAIGGNLNASTAGGNLNVNGGLTTTGNVGINTTIPTRAKLEVGGMIGNTVGLFGSDAQGISLVANWPSLGFNAYFNNGWKSISAGWTGNIYVNQDAGGISFQIGQRSTAANAVVAFVDRFYVGADGVVSIPGKLNFGAQVRQMINLWNTNYGIGVQDGTQYFRSDGDFCWFRGGIHNDSRNNPGTGGVRLMEVNWWGDLILSARTNPDANPNKPLCRALVDLGNKLSVNHGGDFAQGVDIFNGRFVSSRTYKNNIVDLSTEEANQALQGLNPVKFNYRTDAEEELHLGFIAEDVPTLVASPDRQSIGPMDVIAVLTKVVQEQQAAIAALTEKVSALEAGRS
ncbi:MAG: tail fiber domain-containing protein [Leptolyngbyaceae cyanobacterium RU_5_1]|nr:tail fiber domain-containing protein [Leptolyngbyaceae cyanobacterium RU_5_1]